MTTKTTLTETQLQVLDAAADHPLNEVVWFPDTVKGGARGKVLQSLASKGWITETRGHWFLAAGAIAALERDVPPPLPTMPVAALPDDVEQTRTSQVLADDLDEGDPTDEEIAASKPTDTSEALVEEINYSDPADDEITATNDVAEQATPCASDDATTPQAARAAPAGQRTIKSRANSKQATVIAMLRRPEGATIDQICEATGWQHHTIRGTFAGAFKKKLGLTITSEKVQGGNRVYRIG